MSLTVHPVFLLMTSALYYESSLLSLEKACLDELIQLKDWCDANKIQINLNKSCILHLPPKQNTPPLTFQIPYNNSFIVNSIHCKYLGILIDNKLNFKQHIQLVESKIAKLVGILNKLRHIFPSSALLLIYFALVHPLYNTAFPFGEVLSQHTSKNSDVSKIKLFA